MTDSHLSTWHLCHEKKRSARRLRDARRTSCGCHHVGASFRPWRSSSTPWHPKNPWKNDGKTKNCISGIPGCYAQIGDLWVALFLFKDSWAFQRTQIMQSCNQATKNSLFAAAPPHFRAAFGAPLAPVTLGPCHEDQSLGPCNYPTGIGSWQILNFLSKNPQLIFIYTQQLNLTNFPPYTSRLDTQHQSFRLEWFLLTTHLTRSFELFQQGKK